MSGLFHRRVRAPADDGAALVDPPLADIPNVIQRNRELAAEFDRRAGFPSGFRSAARRWLVAREVDQGKTAHAPLILSGHQPELFHPGVWFKNFLLSSLAQSVSGIGVNLVIDNDAIRSPGIRVPTKADGVPEVVVVPFDKPKEELPWEQRLLLEPRLFENFDKAVKQAFSPFQRESAYQCGTVLDRLWPHAVHLATAGEAEQVSNLGLTLARARHRLEQELGLNTVELPLSTVASDEHFLVFIRRLIERHQEFHAAHNTALAEYRLANRVRSHTHPVPELARDGDWHELPLWLWTDENPRRRAAFVRQRGQLWEINDRLGLEISIGSRGGAETGQLSQELQSRSIKLRPRALVTTLYARLVLSDLFIHGIGGAKYDELTDAIIRRFFGIEPPAFVTATATFRLPIERPSVSLADVRKSVQRIRDLRYRPESFVNDPLLVDQPAIRQPLGDLALEKKDYIRGNKLRRGNGQAFAGLNRLNLAMYELLQPLEQHLRAEHAELITFARQTQLLGSREFSFVLFPAEKLPAQLLALSKTIS